MTVDYDNATKISAAAQETLQKRLAELERERDELKRKSEDLQFELEELQINKADAEQEHKDLLRKVLVATKFIWKMCLNYHAIINFFSIHSGMDGYRKRTDFREFFSLWGFVFLSKFMNIVFSFAGFAMICCWVSYTDLFQIQDLEDVLKEGAASSKDIVSGQANLKLVELEAAHRQQMEDLKRKLEDARGELKAIRDMRVSDKQTLIITHNFQIIYSHQLGYS